MMATYNIICYKMSTTIKISVALCDKKYEYLSYLSQERLYFISKKAIKILGYLGYQNIHCVHVFIATANVILQEELKYPLILIEITLSHTNKNLNRVAYGRFKYIDNRADMIQK